MSQPELDRLILNNLADLEAAAQHLESELEPKISDVMDALLETFIHKIQWTGVVDWKKTTPWLAPEGWRKTGDHAGDDFECHFFIDARSKSKAPPDHFWLTKLLGIGVQNIGLRWIRNDVNRKQWKNAVSQQPAMIARLRARGFEYEQADASFFLPVVIDQSTLAQAVADESPALALAPFNDALQTCVDAKPEFDALLAAIAIPNAPQITAAIAEPV